jgi:hypothetical protein
MVAALEGPGHRRGGGGGTYCSCNTVCTCVPVFISDVAVKDDFMPIDAGEVLQRLADLPISTWRYQDDAPDVRHLGPTAQDFATAFGLGDSNRHIHAADASGVALAAVQALAKRVQEQDRTIQELREIVARLRADV